MPEKVKQEGLTTGSKISITLAAMIMGVIVYAFEHVPEKSQVNSDIKEMAESAKQHADDAVKQVAQAVVENQAMSLRISTWAKEEFAKSDTRQVASEARVTEQFRRGHEELLHRLDGIEATQKEILLKLPRRMAGEPQ